MIAEVGAAFGTVDLPQALLQRLAEAAQLGAEGALLAVSITSPNQPRRIFKAPIVRSAQLTRKTRTSA